MPPILMIDAAARLINTNKWSIINVTGDRNKAPIVKYKSSWRESTNSVEPTHDILQAARQGKRPIACIMPSNIFVIDIDKRKDLKPLCKAVGLNLLKYTLAIKTGRGYHLYFKMIKGLEIKKLKGKVELFKNIDLRRNGYMIIPPSLHFKKKQHYTQINNKFDTPQKPPKQLVKLLISLYRQLVSDKDYLTQKDVTDLKPGKPGEPYISNDVLQTALDALNPEIYSNLDDFFRLCAAIHHATAGNKQAREIFIQWARTDNQYNDKTAIAANRRIWNSCK